MIEVSALTQRYGTYTAVWDLSFALDPGEVVGFLGPNGAGKTTTLKVLAAYLAPSRGTVRVAGHDVLHAPLAAKAALGYLPERCPLYEEMAARELLHLCGTVRGLTRPQRRAAIARVAEQCRLGEVLERRCGDLSKGYRQRVGIAQALLHDPPVLILDEPTSGLDPNQVLEMRSLVRELGSARTVLFSSHILSEVEATCARVVVIHQGHLVADDGVAALQRRITGGALRVRFAGGAGDVAPRLRAAAGVASVETSAAAPAGAHELLVRPAAEVEDLPARLFAFAVAEGLVLTHLAPLQVTLEDVFAALTGAGRG